MLFMVAGALLLTLSIGGYFRGKHRAVQERSLLWHREADRILARLGNEKRGKIYTRDYPSDTYDVVAADD